MNASQPCAPLRHGATAPVFRLRCSPSQSFVLTKYAGSLLVLAFYQADWAPACCDQMETLQYFLPQIHGMGAEVVGISVDSVWSHRAFAESRHLDFMLLSDFEPKGEVATLYGVYDAGSGQAHRSLFVIDSRGLIEWSQGYSPHLNPGVAPIVQALESIALPNNPIEAGR